MLVEVILDKDKYIESYSIVSQNENSYLNDAIQVEINEDPQAFRYVYDSYKIEDGAVIFDAEKLTSTLLEPPPMTREEQLQKMIQDLLKRVEELENK